MTLFCVVGGLWVVVLNVKFDQNRLSGYRDFLWVKIWFRALYTLVVWPMAYTEP